LIVIGYPIGWRLSINPPPERLHQTTPAEIDDDFVVLHAIATLHGAKASQKTIVTIAHSSQSAVLEHAPRMHLIPSLPSKP
jgi:hypothetical protein